MRKSTKNYEASGSRLKFSIFSYVPNGKFCLLFTGKVGTKINLHFAYHFYKNNKKIYVCIEKVITGLQNIIQVNVLFFFFDSKKTAGGFSLTRLLELAAAAAG